MQHDALRHDDSNRDATAGDATAGDGTAGDGPRGDGTVGYCRPPRHSRFKPGQSGNPRGRPKGAGNLASLLEAELQRPVTVTEGGRKRRIVKGEAMVASQVNKALKGDTRAFNTVLNATTRRSRGGAGGSAGGGAEGMDPAGSGPDDAETDAMIDRLRDRIARLCREQEAERDRLAAELAAAGVPGEHLDALFGPRGERLRQRMTAALGAVQACGRDIREAAGLSVFAAVAEDCAAALLGDAPGG